MNRQQLQQLAEERLTDAKCLLDASRWSAAYYLAGYAVECGLKACVMKLVETTGIIFQDKKFAEKCWTHNLKELMQLTDLMKPLESDMATSAVLTNSWKQVVAWNEASRYNNSITEIEARRLCDAISEPKDGVLEWISRRW